MACHSRHGLAAQYIAASREASASLDMGEGDDLDEDVGLSVEGSEGPLRLSTASSSARRL